MPISLRETIGAIVATRQVIPDDATRMADVIAEDGVFTEVERFDVEFLLGNASMYEPAAEQSLRTLLGLAPAYGQPPVAFARPSRPATLDAATDADADLDAAEGGGITAAELTAAEEHIAATYGKEVAHEAIKTALADHMGILTVDGAKWVQDAYDSFKGNLLRFQIVFAAHIQNAVVLDANFDGRLDEGDVVVGSGADGTRIVQRISQKVADDSRVAAAMIQACEELAAAQHAFELLDNHRCNPDFFHVEGSTLVLNDGASASAAMHDFVSVSSSSAYGHECATALVGAIYRALHILIGDEDFDRICPDLRIGAWDYEGDLARLLLRAGDASEAGPDEQTVAPGTYAYFRNYDVSAQGRAAGWQGENVIALGEGRFYGHPFGIMTGENIVAELNRFRNPNSTHSASLLRLRMELSREALREDQTPNDGSEMPRA